MQVNLWEGREAEQEAPETWHVIGFDLLLAAASSLGAMLTLRDVKTPAKVLAKRMPK